MTLASLSFAQRLPDHNIVAHSLDRIERGELAELYKELDAVPWVGDKIVSFFIRDLEFFFDLQPYLRQDDYVRMQPLDTWAAEVALRLGVIETKENTPENRLAVVRTCLEAGVDPNRFNVGAYWAGTHGLLEELGIGKAVITATDRSGRGHRKRGGLSS